MAAFWIAVAFAVVLLAGAAVVMVAMSQVEARAVTTMATVQQAVPHADRRGWGAWVGFTTVDGTAVQEFVVVGTEPSVGDRVQVTYDPQRPEVVDRAESFESRWSVLAVLLVSAVLMLGVAGWQWRRPSTGDPRASSQLPQTSDVPVNRPDGLTLWSDLRPDRPR
ncbi:DUF3592 domain-containing protein [Actinocrispum wychmicini]|uniref:DUF3592 domain-containing protein n=1 Tax=Actinocrispum wychmicini TaxID=1213861 RepID=UPI001042991A|nr:DUF3592 domain-containing protein [Actinocrispum wychmicini]